MDFSWPTERPYNAVVKRVVDGDTLRCDIDLGFHIWFSDFPVRLLGCNAAEHGTPAGKAAKANLEKLLPPDTAVVLSMVKNYKYGGEFVAKVWLNGEDLVASLVQQNWVAAWDGNGPRPLAPWPRPKTSPAKPVT